MTPMSPLSAQEADLALCRCEDGVEAALQYTKMWCRYAKDLLAWMEKRITLGEWRRHWLQIYENFCNFFLQLNYLEKLSSSSARYIFLCYFNF